MFSTITCKGNGLTGFTLIELVIVIIILGILAVVALPKFVDISGDARTAAAAGVAGALSSANAINYSTRKLNVTKGNAVANCQDVASALQGGLPAGYTITSAAVASDATTTCTLTGPSSVVTSFQATGIS